MKTAMILGAAVWQTGPSPTLMRRTMHGADLFHKKQVSHLVVCGGVGKHPPSEAQVMADILIADVPVMIVSDWYHTPRALLIAKRAGLSAEASSPRLSGARIWPQLKGALREIPAYLLYWLRFKS